jgi:CheY-like chemotaxis protein
MYAGRGVKPVPNRDARDTNAAAPDIGRAPRRARILCVDDEPGVLTILSRALGNHYDIVTVEDPVLALDLLRNEADFSVVISDLKMPQMDGADFLARAKRIAPGSSRLALTASLDRELTSDQVLGILTKPFPLRLLHESVTAAVQHHLLRTQPDSLLPDTLLRRSSPRPIRPTSSVAPPSNDDVGGVASESPAIGWRELAGSLPDAAGDDRPGTLALLATLAQKLFLLEQAEKAETLLRAPLEDLAVRVRHGLLPAATDSDVAVELALRLAEETGDPSWIDYVFLLFLELRRPLSTAVIDRLHALMRRLPGASRAAVGEYLAMLHATLGALGEADRSSIERIEALAQSLRR